MTVAAKERMRQERPTTTANGGTWTNPQCRETRTTSHKRLTHERAYKAARTTPCEKTGDRRSIALAGSRVIPLAMAATANITTQTTPRGLPSGLGAMRASARE